jgi:hypothetical protein
VATSAARPADTTNTFIAVHSLALRSTLARLPEGSDSLLAAGLIRSAPDGYELTELGHRRHRALLEIERRTLDLGLLEMAYAQLPTVTHRLRELSVEWRATEEDRRGRLIPGLCALVGDVELIIRRSSAVAPRFASYLKRLETARSRLLGGQLDYAVGDDVDSILAIWREMNEDYLQTLGCARDQGEL